MKFKLIGTLFVLLLILPVVSAQLLYQSEEAIQLKIPCINNGTLCSDAATCDITIVYPNSSTLINMDSMTNNAGQFTYDLTTSQTSTTGIYHCTMNCTDGSIKGTSTFEYEITTNGNASPEGTTIIFFSALFILVCASLVGLFLYTLGKFVEKEFNMWDLIYNLSAYFTIIAIYFLSKEYLGNAGVNDMMEFAIAGAGITNCLFPLIVFILSFTLWKWQELNQWGV